MRALGLSLVRALALSSCSGEVAPSKDQHPFVGCWESEDGLKREVWAQDPSGWLFGYALDRKSSGEVSFYEQMRIEYQDGTEAFVVSAADGVPVKFERDVTDSVHVYRYINPAHEFPQVITCTVSEGRLDAVINVMDGSNPVAFKKRACSRA